MTGNKVTRRVSKLNCGIYKILNIITGECYIGQSSQLGRRKWRHYYMLKRGGNDNINLQDAYDKYGRDSILFVVLIYCEKFELTRYEQFFVNTLKPEYNIYKECVISPKGYRFSDEIRLKLSKHAIGNKNSLGHMHSPETRKKLSDAGKRRALSQETRDRISKAMMGNKNAIGS